ncbi:MORN repeat-containing protein 5-like isoform X2 [Maniola jurtina]|uniref:MORN repeat-containing protein 5-like isoform X2 n=1 Tax=Maniola jurtina TaxID=191418 RepID=UPI001E68AFFF|nr:MORN repeat-containing protein 5-like isoform X2 [Maniola jurtina]
MSLSKSRGNSASGTKRASQWEDLMRKFSEAHKEECKTVSVDMPRVQRSMKMFPTGSQYEGSWDLLGMSGYGVYKFPNDVIYEGEFDDGMFHGQGKLKYPNGVVLRGTWKKGKLTDRTLVFADGLEYDEMDWKYCRPPDRRFTIEYEKGLQPAGKSFLTAEQPTRPIPPGYYDTGDGFYDPKTKAVYKVDDLSAIVRSPSVREQKWIIENCRTCPDKSLGPRIDLYEEWVEPQDTLPKPPKPASTSHANGSLNLSQTTYEQDLEMEVAFKNLEVDESDSSESAFSSCSATSSAL